MQGPLEEKILYCFQTIVTIYGCEPRMKKILFALFLSFVVFAGSALGNEAGVFLNIIQAHAESNPDGFFLREATNFRWDKVCIYEEYSINSKTTVEEVEMETGINLDNRFDLRNMDHLFNGDLTLFLFGTGSGYRYFYLSRDYVEINKEPYFLRSSGSNQRSAGVPLCLNDDAFVRPERKAKTNILWFVPGEAQPRPH